MVGDSVEFLRGAGPAGVLRRRALLRRLQAQPRVLPAGAAGRGRGAAPRRSCCATPTAARCRTRSRTSIGRGGAALRPTPTSACTSTTTAAAAWPTPWPACAGGATQVQGCINGYGERTGNANLCTIIPNLTLKMGVRHDPGRPAGAAHAGVAPHRRAGQHHPRPAAALRRAVGLRPQGRAAHVGHRPGARRLRARRPRAVGNGTRFVVSELAGRSTLAAQGQGARPRRWTAPRCADVLDQLKDARAPGLPLRGGRRLARAADAAGDAAGSRTSSSSSRSGSSPSSGRTAASSPRPRSRSTSAASGVVATAEGNGPVNALDQRPAHRPSAGATRRSQSIHLTDYKVRVLDTAKGTGAVTRVLHRLDRRRARRGRPSACRRTSSRRRGRRCWTRSSTACWSVLRVLKLRRVRRGLWLMAQPDYVPIDAGDRVRAVERLPAPDRWVADRPRRSARPTCRGASAWAGRGPTRGTR